MWGNERVQCVATRPFIYNAKIIIIWNSNRARRVKSCFVAYILVISHSVANCGAPFALLITEMRIKRLYLFILQTFLPLFAMTFFIVLFIVMMQFLWRYIDDLVGKGLEFKVIAELFFYAAVSMVPMALPLAILLASLMTFGNLGEKFELTAMKASGISLLKVMSPLIVLMCFVSVGAFFFQNNVLPKAQVKMWTLLFSMRQKSPELEIPEGVFYDQIPGYNLFVKDKDPQTGMLHNVMIYDVQNGGDNSTIIMADSARLAMAPDMSHLYLRLMKGEQFENLRQMSGADRNVPFRREEFFDKEVLIPFDANFNRLDEQGMRDQYVGKNVAELQETIDSVTVRLDSIGAGYARDMRRGSLPFPSAQLPSEGGKKSVPAPLKALNVDSLLQVLPIEKSTELLRAAKNVARTRQIDLDMKTEVVAEEKKTIRRHGIEFYRRFTLSVACLVFFFIGAPLGAIIRKGGLGTPLVISILLFLFYYIIDNTGYKMARDGRWPVWAGMWLSSVVLAPLGIYVTWRAMNDSAVFDKDRYLSLIRKIFGTRSDRHVEYKEVVIDELSDERAAELILPLADEARRLSKEVERCRNYKSYWGGEFPSDEYVAFVQQLEEAVSQLTNSRNQRLLAMLPEVPVLRRLAIYRFSRHRWVGIALGVIFPVGVPVWLLALRSYRILNKDLKWIATHFNRV